MIKEKELSSVNQIRFRNGDNITLEALQEALTDKADSYAIPVAFRNDQVRYGSIISSNIVDCLVLYHPNHVKDYYNYVLKLTRQGRYAFLDVSMSGRSSQLGKEASSENVKTLLGMGNLSAYGKGAVVGSLIASIGKNKKKIEEERNWYTMVNDIFDDVVQ